MPAMFSTPTAYLEHLQVLYAREYPSGTPDDAFRRKVDSDLAKFDLSIESMGPFGGLRLALRDVTKELFRSMDNEAVDKLSADVAIGVLPTGEANAFIARSPCGKYAVLVCSGLMLLLHKYLKLVRAFVTPEEIVHCNRKSASEVTKSDVDHYIHELIGNHHHYGVPYGPMIRLSGRASKEHSILLNLAELFIVCHELGHYYNGDLFELSAYSNLIAGAAGKRYIENTDHEVEYSADVAGYGLYLTCLEVRGISMPSLEVLKPVLATFNLLYALAGGESSTHPHPYDRAVRIACHHYGNEQGERLAAALQDPETLPNFYESSKVPA